MHDFLLFPENGTQTKRKNALVEAKAVNGSDSHIGASRGCVRKLRGSLRKSLEYEDLHPFDMSPFPVSLLPLVCVNPIVGIVLYDFL